MSKLLALIRGVLRRRPDEEELDGHTLDDIGLTRMGLLNMAEFGPRSPEDGRPGVAVPDDGGHLR